MGRTRPVIRIQIPRLSIEKKKKGSGISTIVLGLPRGCIQNERLSDAEREIASLVHLDPFLVQIESLCTFSENE